MANESIEWGDRISGSPEIQPAAGPDEHNISNDRIQISEEDHPEKTWFEEARKQTTETLPAFVNHMMGDYCHDYGTVCHAIAACGLAAICAADNHPNGGITGFQASAVMWDIIRQMNFRHNKTGLRIVDYDQMLYPQYEYKFTERTISPERFQALQEAAAEQLSGSDHAAPRVVEHWQSIVDGHVPFGYTIKED